MKKAQITTGTKRINEATISNGVVVLDSEGRARGSNEKASAIENMTTTKERWLAERATRRPKKAMTIMNGTMPPFLVAICTKTKAQSGNQLMLPKTTLSQPKRNTRLHVIMITIAIRASNECSEELKLRRAKTPIQKIMMCTSKRVESHTLPVLVQRTRLIRTGDRIASLKKHCD